MKKTITIHRWTRDVIDVAVDFPAYQFNEMTDQSSYFREHRRWVRYDADGTQTVITYFYVPSNKHEQWTLDTSLRSATFDTKEINSTAKEFAKGMKQMLAFAKKVTP